MTRSGRVVVVCLAGVILSLLLVGVVSRTLLRHIVQISPVAVALLLTARIRGAAHAAAGAIFLFWLAIMVFIWLFLLGVATIVSGTFTTAEVALTISIGICCLAGLPASFAEARGSGILRRIAFLVVFAALQFGAMWLSLQPGIARR